MAVIPVTVIRAEKRSRMADDILDSIKRSSNVLFYPSSCDYSPRFQDIPFDAVILNSASIEPQVIGKVCCLNYDNNELLGLLLAKGIRLSAVVVIRDGCAEGGNYECCANDGFFGRLMPVVSESFEYLRDHGPKIIDVPAQCDECEIPGYLDAFVEASNPIRAVSSYRVTVTSQTEREVLLGQIRVRTIWDSIWKAYDQHGLIVVKDNVAVSHYLGGLGTSQKLVASVERETKSRMTSIEPWLKRADDLGLRRVSLIPMGGRRYKKIIREIQCWSRDYPQEISFYHLNRNDFQDFKSLWR
jgi:hypothetical protein